jgi:hypothetical protein
MLTIVVTLFMGLLILAAFVLVFINRDSEKIVTAAVPLAFAAFSGLALIFAFARQEPISRVFPVSFAFQVADKVPITIPHRPIPWVQLFLIDELRQREPKALEEQPDVQGMLVYHEFLQKALVDWIASRHFKHWRMELLLFDGGPGAGTEARWSGMPDAKEELTDVLSVEELQSIFSGNRFASVHSDFGTLAVPPGTSLSVEVPKEAGATGKILFRNRYCEITIQTSFSASTMGIRNYSRLLGLPDFTPGYWTQGYIVRIEATFSPWLVGHPRMARIRQWATGIVNGLQNEFDEQVIWRKTVENYRFHQNLPNESKGSPLPLGPMQAQPPAKN